MRKAVGTKSRIGVWLGSLVASESCVSKQIVPGICNNLKSTSDAQYLAITGVAYNYGVVTFEAFDLDFYTKFMSSPGCFLGPREIGIRPIFVPADQLDSILSFDCYDALWAWPLKKFGIKTACVIGDLGIFRAPEINNSNRVQEFFKALSTVIEKADKLLCVSNSTATDLRAFFPEAEGRIEIIQPGVTRAFGSLTYFPIVPQGTKIPKTTNVLMVDTWEERKNFISILAAAPLIAERIPNSRLQFTIIGSGDAEADGLGSRYGKVLQQAKAVSDVFVPTDADQMALSYWYGKADILVCPSLWGGFGHAILEAMMAGLPVVASDIPCHREVGRDYIRYYDSYDMGDIADQILGALAINEMRRAGETLRAQSWALRFTWDRTAAQCHYALSELAGDALDPSDLEFGAGRLDEAQAHSHDAFLLRLSDLISPVDLRHISLTNHLKAARGYCILLAVAASDFQNHGIHRAMEAAASFLYALGDVSTSMILLGDTRSFSQEHLQVIQLLNGLGLDDREYHDPTTTEIEHLICPSTSFNCATLYLTDQIDLAELAMESLTCNQLVVYGETSPILGHNINIQTIELRTADQTLHAPTIPNDGFLTFYTSILQHGSLSSAILHAEQTGNPGRAKHRGGDLSQSPAMAVEFGVKRVVLAYDEESYGLAQDAVNRSTDDGRDIVVLVRSLGEPAAFDGEHHFLLSEPKALQLLITASSGIVGLLPSHTRHMPDEIRFARSLNKPVTVVGLSLDAYAVRALSLKTSPSVHHALEASGDLQQQGLYPMGLGVLLDAARRFNGPFPPQGVDELTLRHLLQQGTIEKFGKTLDSLGLNHSGWQKLALYVENSLQATRSGTPREKSDTSRPDALQFGFLMMPFLKSLRRRLANHYVSKADRLRDAHKWRQASEIYRAALELNPDLAPIWVQYGHSLKEGGDIHQAEKAYMRSLEIDPGVYDTYLQIGHVRKISGRLREASLAYFSALAANCEAIDPRVELSALGYSASAIDIGLKLRQKIIYFQ